MFGIAFKIRQFIGQKLTTINDFCLEIANGVLFLYLKLGALWGKFRRKTTKISHNSFNIEEFRQKLREEDVYLSTRPLKKYWRYTLRPFIYNLPSLPKDIYRTIRKFIQRGRFGISDEDVWSLDGYLNEVTLRGLKILKETKTGTPLLDGFNDESDYNEMSEEWLRILDTMIWTFEAAQKISNSEWILHYDKLSTKQKKAMAKIFHLMTKKEIEKYEEGWKNFTRYYFALWS